MNIVQFPYSLILYLIIYSLIIHSLIILRLAQDGIDDEQEAEKAYGRGYLDAAHAEYVGVECRFGASGTGHENKTEDDDCHSDGQQNEVHFVECKVSFIHGLFFLLFLDSIHVRGLLTQIFVHAEVGAA